MDKINALLQLGDEFDALGHNDLADRIATILRKVADSKVKVNYEHDHPYSHEEEQRLVAIEYKHLYHMFLATLPQIDYLKPYWDALRAALDHVQIVIQHLMEEKTNAFDFSKFHKRFEYIERLKQRFQYWNKQPVSKDRVIIERQLMLSPIKLLIQRLARTYEDDESLESIKQELTTLVNVFTNVLGQTTEEIAGLHFPKGL